MHVYSLRIDLHSWKILLLGIAVTLPAAHDAVAQANATNAATQDLPATARYETEYFTTDLSSVFRLRHMEGRGQGDVPAYTNLGFTKLVWDEQGVLMLDLGARLTNDAEPGFTCGAHRRIVFRDFLLGTGLFYDQQQYEEDFHQLSAAGELFYGPWAFRTNGYYIIGDDVKRDADYSTTGSTSTFFEGNHFLADNLILTEEFDVAMSGFDIELARQLGWHATELFVGSYFYDGEIGEDAFGGKGGVRGFVVPDLAASVTISGDDLFGVNVFAGFTWYVGARGGLSRPNMARRITLPVERNEQIVVNQVERQRSVVGPITLTDEDDPIFIIHVQEGAAGANEGTFEDPFNSLPGTQEADIVYVHADGVFVGQSYSLAADQRFLGEGSGNLHSVDTEELGKIVLPAGNGGANRPEIQTALGNAVTLSGEGNEVSNFAITNSTEHGIFGEGSNDFDINRNVVTDSGDRGIFLNNVTGDVETAFIASGDVSGNVVTNSDQQNIQIVLASDFEGDLTGNTADSSANSQGISITGPFRFDGDVENNTASGNSLDGILVDVDQFVGDISDNTANSNLADGLFLTFGFGEVDIEGNTTNLNGDIGIDLTIAGDFFSDVDLFNNTANNNTAEGMSLTFAGTGTSVVDVLNNSFSGNNGGVNREFIAQVEDVFENRPTAYIELDGNTSTNALGAGPPFNYEFENSDLFSDGRMFVEIGANVGTVGLGEGVEQGELH